MKRVTWLDKLGSSIINILIVGIIFLPLFVWLDLSDLESKFLFIGLFFLYKLIFLFANKNRTIGMMIMKTGWERNYPLYQQILHSLLYTLSFSTLLFWIVFPFDLFLANMLLLQLPAIKITGMTLHEYLAGRMQGIKQ